MARGAGMVQDPRVSSGPFNLYEKFSKTIESWNARRSEKKVAQAAREKLKTERQAYASVFSVDAAVVKPIAAGSVVFPVP